MTQTDVDSEDALIQAMQDDLELVVMREVCESIQTEKGSDKVSQKKITLECNKRKNTVMKLLNASVKTQRLYFVLR